MKTAIFLPPLSRVSGGLAVLIQVGEHLARQGREVCFVPRETSSVSNIMALSTGVPIAAWEEAPLNSRCLWLVPEGWPNALARGLSAGARCAVYVQNWAYALGGLPMNARWDRLPVRWLAVSHPVRWFLQETIGQEALILRPSIDAARFHPPARDAAAPVKGPLRVAWMPRKNKALARYVREAATARLSRLHPDVTLEWIEIHERTQTEVAELMRTAHIFLSTGFPEGYSLPPLEAMASGCLVIGFSGLGGWDYMRQALPEAPFAFRPWWPLRPAAETPWSGNGLFTADADVPGTALALEAACLLLREGGPPLAELRRAAATAAAAYSLEAQERAVASVWDILTA